MSSLIVTVTGCCHPGILSLFSYARNNFEGYKPYGCYGGLHISLFETWSSMTTTAVTAK